MTVNIEKNEKEMKVLVEGRVDTTTAPELEKQIDDNISDVNNVTLDLAKLDYISSAGLRVLLKEQKYMNSKSGKMTLINVKDEVMEVLTITGFISILNIE